MADINELIEEDDSVVSGYLLSDGEVVSSSYFEKARKSKSNESNALDTDEDQFGEAYASGLVYKPTLVFKNLKSFSGENTYHQRCINQIAVDCCSDWEIIPLDKFGNKIPKIERKRKKQDNILYDFFEHCSKDDDFLELCKMMLIDYQTFGWTNIEMTRNKIALPKGLYHVPTETMRIARNLSAIMDTDEKFMVQIVNNHERVFKIFGKDKFSIMIEPYTKNVMTEVLFMRNYHVDGGKYGIPNWFPAVKSMVGTDKVAEYNINFFNNEAVPRFAVIVSGGKLDEGTKTSIKNYFKSDLKGVKNAHKTLVLTSPKGVEVKLIPLATDIKDGSFRLYRKDNRDEIITAHGVPHHRIQVLDSGNSGTISPGTIFQLDKTYKYSIVLPLQQKIQSVFNRIIRYGFGIEDRVLEFKELDIGEDTQKAEVMKTIAGAHEKYYSIGAMTPNDIMQDLNLQPYTKDNIEADQQDILEWASTPRPIYLIRQAQLQASNELQANTASGNLNETSNEFGDKSRQQTQGNTQFNDAQLNELTMKRNVVLKVLKQLDMELEKNIKLSNINSEDLQNEA
jgi:PBSX family phage portal protein